MQLSERLSLDSKFKLDFLTPDSFCLSQYSESQKSELDFDLKQAYFWLGNLKGKLGNIQNKELLHY